MTTCAVMIARDEADIIEATLRHTIAHVDDVIVADHRSVDGTREIAERLGVTVLDLTDRGFTFNGVYTWLGLEALERGHGWALIVDADDIWHVTADPVQRIAEYLASIHGDYLTVGGWSTNHVPTSLDPDEPNPVLRIGWREVNADAKKVACRLRPDFTYGDHSGWYGGVVAPPTIRNGLSIRHFTIRSAEQLVRKIRNGMDAALAAVADGAPAEYADGWDQWKGLTDDDVRARFRERFWSDDPTGDSLIYDPAPWAGQVAA